MNAYQQRLLDEALDQWERGFRISTNLYATMAQQGMDVQTLEETHYVESPNQEEAEED